MLVGLTCFLCPTLVATFHLYQENTMYSMPDSKIIEFSGGKKSNISATVDREGIEDKRKFANLAGAW